MTVEAPTELRIIITKFRKDEDGIYRARVSLDGFTVEFERKGGWVTTQEFEGAYREAKPAVAAALQQKVPHKDRYAYRVKREKKT